MTTLEPCDAKHGNVMMNGSAKRVKCMGTFQWNEGTFVANDVSLTITKKGDMWHVISSETLVLLSGWSCSANKEGTMMMDKGPTTLSGTSYHTTNTNGVMIPFKDSGVRTCVVLARYLSEPDTVVSIEMDCGVCLVMPSKKRCSECDQLVCDKCIRLICDACHAIYCVECIEVDAKCSLELFAARESFRLQYAEETRKMFAFVKRAGFQSLAERILPTRECQVCLVAPSAVDCCKCGQPICSKCVLKTNCMDCRQIFCVECNGCSCAFKRVQAKYDQAVQRLYNLTSVEWAEIRDNRDPVAQAKQFAALKLRVVEKGTGTASIPYAGTPTSAKVEVIELLSAESTRADGKDTM